MNTASVVTVAGDPVQRGGLSDLVADHPVADVILGGLLLAAYAAVTSLLPRTSILYLADFQQRQVVFGAGAGVLSLIAGFTTNAISQYVSSTSSLVSTLKAAHGDSIRKNWLSIIRSLLFCAVLCLLCLVLNSEKAGPRFSDVVFVSAILLAVCKFVRLSLIYGMLLTAVDRGTTALKVSPPAVTRKTGAS